MDGLDDRLERMDGDVVVRRRRRRKTLKRRRSRHIPPFYLYIANMAAGDAGAR